MGIKEYAQDEQYKDYNINLACSYQPEDSLDDQYYNNIAFKQPVVKNSGMPYEMCPHYPEQCDADSYLLNNIYSKNSKL